MSHSRGHPGSNVSVARTARFGDRVYEAIPVTPQTKTLKSDPPPIPRAIDKEFWVPSLVRKDRFEATAPKHFECCLCGDPALPFTVLTPCGHCACQDCAEDSTRCPQCERPILARTVVRQLEGCVRSSLTFECKTRRCTFRATDANECFHHRCDEGSSYPLDRNEPRGEGRRSVSSNDVRGASYELGRSDGPKTVPDDGKLEPSLTVQRRKTILFWDFDSLDPLAYGVSEQIFYRRLLGCVVGSCGVSATDLHTTAYIRETTDARLLQSLQEMGIYVRTYPSSIDNTTQRSAFNGRQRPVKRTSDEHDDEQWRLRMVGNDINNICESIRIGSLTSGPLPVTMFDVVIVTGSALFAQGGIERQQHVGLPLFFHVVSDLAMQPDENSRMIIQSGVITYVDVADFLY